MMFVELLFWKNQKESEEVRDEYNWRVSYDLMNEKPLLTGFCTCIQASPSIAASMLHCDDFSANYF